MCVILVSLLCVCVCVFSFISIFPANQLANERRQSLRGKISLFVSVCLCVCACFSVASAGLTRLTNEKTSAGTISRQLFPSPLCDSLVKLATISWTPMTFDASSACLGILVLILVLVWVWLAFAFEVAMGVQCTGRPTHTS